MLEQSVIIGFFINIYSSLVLLLRRLSEKSLILGFFRYLKGLFCNFSDGSLTIRAAARESYLSRKWTHSFAARLIDVCFNSPVRFVSPAFEKAEHFLKTSIAFKILNVILDYLHIWIALFLIMVIAIPHASWTNLYSTAAAIVFLFLFLLKMVVRKEKQPVLMVTDVFLIIFLISVLLAWACSVSPSESLRFLVFYITCFVLFIMMALSIKSETQLMQVVNFLLIGITLSGLYGLWQGIVGVPVNEAQVDVTLFAGEQGRIWSTFDNPNNFAEVLILFIPFYFSAALNAKRLPAKLLYLALSVPCLASLLYTKSRGAWLGFLVAAVIFMFIKGRKFIPLFIILGLVCIPFLPDSIVNRFTSIFNFKESSNKTRLDIYKTVWPMLRDYWFTGLGLGTNIFKRLIQSYPIVSKMVPNHAHNLFLQIWIETGLLGFLSFIGFMVGLFKRSVKAIVNTANKSLSYTILAAIFGITAISAAAMTDHIWFNPRVMLLFWGVCGLLSASLLLIQKKDTPDASAIRKIIQDKASDNTGNDPGEYSGDAVGM